MALNNVNTRAERCTKGQDNSNNSLTQRFTGKDSQISDKRIVYKKSNGAEIRLPLYDSKSVDVGPTPSAWVPFVTPNGTKYLPVYSQQNGNIGSKGVYSNIAESKGHICNLCYTNCNNNYSNCQRCVGGCNECNSCTATGCNKCNSCNGGCNSCDGCTGCNSCTGCNDCRKCVSCNGGCYGCVSCDTCQGGCYGCVTCHGSCYGTCYSSSCTKCNSCQGCYGCKGPGNCHENNCGHCHVCHDTDCGGSSNHTNN